MRSSAISVRTARARPPPRECSPVCSSPRRGIVEYDGRDIRDDLVAFRRRLGYIPEEPYLYPFLSGREYLQLVGRLRELPETLLTDKIDGFLGCSA